MKYSVYILRNNRNKLYVSFSSNLHDRLIDHKTGEGSKYVRDHLGFQLVYTEEYQTQVEAMQREKQLKGWTRAKKEALVSGDIKKLKKL